MGFSLSWELDYVHILDLLERQGIPLQAEARGEADPLVFGGGPVLTANPEPFAAFFGPHPAGGRGRAGGTDDPSLPPGAAGIPSGKAAGGWPRCQGSTCPASTRCTTASPRARWEKVIPKLGRDPQLHPQAYLPPATPSRFPPWLPPRQPGRTSTWWRWCAVVRRWCRFCLASYLTLPFRAAEVEGHLIPAVERGLQVTQRIGLLGASVTQHPQFEQLLEYLAQDRFERVRLSLASVRTGHGHASPGASSSPVAAASPSPWPSRAARSGCARSLTKSWPTKRSWRRQPTPRPAA
jgi:hypothetical protein